MPTSDNYLITGDNDYLREREIKKIKERFLSSHTYDLNYSVYSAADIAGLKSSLLTAPFLSDKRVVLLKEAETLRDEQVDEIIAYLKAPCETTIFVISAHGTIGKRREFNELSRMVTVIDAAPPSSHTIKGWIRTFFAKENIEISSDAVSLIVELKGSDVASIRTELDKLADYASDDKIELRDVEDLTGRSVVDTVFKLVDAINARDAAWAFRILDDLYSQKKRPVEIMGYLAWYIRMMQDIKHLSGKGMEVSAMASELRHSYGHIQGLKRQADAFSPGRIKHWIFLLFKADRDIKSGAKDPFLSVEMVVSGLVTPEKPPIRSS